MSTKEDQARLIAERVARRFAGDVPAGQPETERTSNGVESVPERPRARMIDFISSGPPLRSAPAVARPAAVDQPPQVSSQTSSEFFQFVPVTQSPWLGRLPSMLANANPHSVDHPSQQRFGVEEATVAELVEFFENEKKCSMDPSGKPCDHCAMCSSRGF
ncbi:MAG TPA: hypothetical protein VGQ72_11285 [Pyrinomonadaceae bacterium]|nr:hypothetical protein [Pyrinomonadaceae bacterium]